MKRLQKYIVIFRTAMLCVGFSACSKQSDFDAKSYVQSSLDAEYHGTYADYVNLMEISEEDAKKQIVHIIGKVWTLDWILLKKWIIYVNMKM